MAVTLADQIRAQAIRTMIAPARRQGQRNVRISVRDLHRQLKLKNNQFPAVCMALKSKKFWGAERLRIEKIDGPPSGQSSTVVFTFTLEPETSTGEDWVQSLRGLFRGMYDEDGGGEAWLKKERGQFRSQR